MLNLLLLYLLSHLSFSIFVQIYLWLLEKVDGAVVLAFVALADGGMRIICQRLGRSIVAQLASVERHYFPKSTSLKRAV
ncbi:hypothetical protein T4D_2995 [Trichinella pseudospiralis]|uniref:ABC transmembrane type-1 domain-containing protein n=1 Tax=Trichinella pseudospiralis TaxID=6337 RepID=A0A0V1FHA1_TRIPS|nr:hypothetical protein T4D_2995 [Trichinella pseudospiralis]